MKKTDFDIYLIETIQDYLNYKQARHRKEEEIKSIKKESKSFAEKSDGYSTAREDDVSFYRTKRNCILIDSILSYIESMSASEIDDVKTIQLMLLKLTHGKCDDDMYQRIMNVDRVVAKKASNNFKFEAGSNNNIYAGGDR